MCEQNPSAFRIDGDRLDGLKKDDRAEWQRLIDEMTPRMSRHIAWRLRLYNMSQTPSDDIVQSMWVTIWHKVVTSFDGVEITAAYLRQAADWVILALRRKQHMERGIGAIDPEQDVLNMLEAPIMECGLELADSFETMLNQAEPPLTEQESTTVRLRIVGERTYDEISRTLDIPLGTVAGAYYRAIKKLRKGLGDEAGEGT